MAPEKTWPVGIGAASRDLLMHTQALLARKGLTLSFRQIVEAALLTYHDEVVVMPDHAEEV